MQGQALVVRSTIHSAWLSEVLPAPKRGYSGFVLSKYCTASSPAQPGRRVCFYTAPQHRTWHAGFPQLLHIHSFVNISP